VLDFAFLRHSPLSVVPGAVALWLGALATAGCSSPPPVESRSPFEELDALLRPQAQATSVKRLPSAHMTASAMFRVSPAGPVSGDAASDKNPKESVTTKTELWLDRRGQYRLVETNDQDGGRVIVRYGHDLAVALRYGKTIRRPALEPEPTRYLEEAVGGPWAAWETVRRFATVTRGPAGYQLARNAAHVVVVHSGEGNNLRRWRDTVEVQQLVGEARVDPRTGALLAYTLNAHFTATRPDGTPLDGELAVTSRIDSIGSTGSVVAPAAEELEPRPRSILEERTLLGDLNRPTGKEPR
jgi:hypothetical protein